MTEIIDLKTRAKQSPAQVPLDESQDNVIKLLEDIIQELKDRKEDPFTMSCIVILEKPAAQNANMMRILTLNNGSDHLISMVTRAQLSIVAEWSGVSDPSLPEPETKA